MINGKKILAVILARAGSKGIPMKNVRDLLGKPLFMWSVEAALKSKYVDKIVISSNCPFCKLAYHTSVAKKQIDVNNMTKQGRVEWINRPEEISGDLSKNEDALIHSLHHMRLYGWSPDIVLNLQVTSPCRLGELTDRCIEAYDEGGYDSLLTAKKDTPFLWRKENGKWIYPVDNHDCCDRKMRQEFKDTIENSEFVWHDCGSIFMTDTKVLLEKKCRIGKNPCVYEVDGINSLQIDEEFDFLLIENMAKVLKLDSLI